MCGISGEFRFDQKSPNLSVIEDMNDANTARGPDSVGVFTQNNLALGHRRLMIMDLSPQSQQPMFDPGLGLAIAFNGAIYNYRELRGELEQQGYTFYSDGDTEVILKSYHAWGEDCLKRFNGMFAFAIWQRDKNELFVARDRLGIKPFYYSQTGNFFRFCSSLPALARSPEVNKDISPTALNFYLNFHAVVPAPHTIIDGVKKLEPGHAMRISENGDVSMHRWWELDFNQQIAEADFNFEEGVDNLLSELRQAVRRRNVAAVDVGVLLSGGVDSSLLVGLLAEFKDTPIKTFSIGFETVNQEEGDEFKYSDVIVDHFQTDHTKFRVGEAELLETLPKAIQAMSEPMVSHDCVAFYLLAQTVAKTCKVVQSGQGADEVFGGYHWYPPLQGSTNPFESYRKAFFDREHSEYQNTLQKNWLTDDMAGEFVKAQFEKAGAPHPVDKALRLDTTVMLVDDPVKRVDNMTMAASLEARVPFLDHQLVEHASTIPAAYKLKDGGKYILKEAARKVIPAAVIDRPKGYFPVPALKYLKGEVLGYVKDALHNQAARDRGLFQTAYVDNILKDPESHITPLRGSKLWQMGLLELWLQSQGI